MVTIDLANMSVRKVNEILRGFGATHQNAEVLNPDAKHYIGVGLISPITVRVRGSAGYYCGGLCDGPRFEVDKNVSWGVGDNLLAGSLVVGGNASAIAGVGMRGGDIVIRGNMGSRAGQVMKKGTLCCAGNASFMAGYMMYGGRIIILGNSGERVGEDMMGGEIYIGGKIDSLGNDAMQVEPSSTEVDDVTEFLDRYDIPLRGCLKKVVCTGKTLRYGTAEPRQTKLSYHFLSAGDGQSYWSDRIQEDIRVKAHIGRYRIRGYGASRPLPHFPDIAFKADLSKAGLEPDVVSKVNLRTFLGDKHGGRALDLSMPVLIAPMSYGALSKEMKLSLGIASRLSGISENSGEGGMLSEERAEARWLIAQCLAGRLGWNVHDMKRSDCIEIYVSQGAKPGLGGQLMAEKLTAEIAAVRGIPAGMDLRSPSRHPDILGGDDLIMKVEELREATGWRVPISIKLGAGRIRDDIKIALKDGIDFVQLDGMQGGTGAAGNEVIENVGIPTIAGLQEALDGLEEIDCSGQLPIVLMGGLKDGVDAAKAIALGASAVAYGSAMLVAAGCIACMQCSAGNCVIGAATQDPKLTGRFDIEKRALQIHRYLEAVRWQMAAIAHAHGYSDIRQLSRNDLVALTPEAAALTRLPYDPSYRERMAAAGGWTEADMANYSKQSHEHIHAMAKTDPGETERHREILQLRLGGRKNPFPPERSATLDDLVFLPAALTRLVIDPYREACSTKTELGKTLVLEQPYLFTGFDEAPENVREALASAISSSGCAYVGFKPLVKVAGKSDAHDEPGASSRVPWLQLIALGKNVPSPEADGLIYVLGDRFEPVSAKRLHEKQLIGLCAGVGALAEAIPYALENGFDLFALDGSAGIGDLRAELSGRSDLKILRDAIALLRGLDREEELDLLYFGGLRSGTDAAKILALNCKAGVFGMAVSIALGCSIGANGLCYDENLSVEERACAAQNWIKGTVQETAIIARCTGKTNVHNLEPEDMRAITLAGAEATAIPLASGRAPREYF